MPLTDTAIRNAKPKAKQYKIADEKGMYLLVKPNGSKYFRLDYRIHGKRKTYAIGVYPSITLKKARQIRDTVKEQITDGIDPCEHKKATKRMSDSDSFEAVARDWHNRHKPNWTENHAGRILTRLEKDIFPWVGKRQISTITPPELLAVLRRIESRGALETVHRAMQNCSQVFRYAVATGKAERDPTQDLKGALPPVKKKHLASITEPKQIAELLRAIDGYKGHFISKCAMRLAPLVFVRPGELRQAEWSEIDLDNAEWKIPAEKMKMRQVHIVPLSRQAIAILEEIKPLTGAGKYVFPSIRTNTRPMSENTVLAGLRRLGYSKEEMTGHGFRSMASTLLNEQGWNRDAIERQLAHSERDSVRAAYNYAEHLQERAKMMQAWSDYLDGLKQGATVIPFKQAAGK
ncbi:tyrosine-type recombinase/integrase [methane-oxidizing endosymbiont of Gigantopelta aegis]|uniref:tyrosine-type recombinase/integrase n=1 Tax=methane-oxidizing endosymbiont of Gigantopelta aegis TaxID=2794938 RepID=UPI0018DDF649|nr:integrase arm-type DNA-binding domain-containing protein [methane-oxidizing endosymbiont of Gigantopelta aegis]